MAEHKWPKINLVKVGSVFIGIGTRIRDNHPITIDEVYLNTLLPDEVKGKSKSAKQRRKDEEKKYKKSVAAANEAIHRWNSHNKLQAENDKMCEMLLAAGFIGNGTQLIGDDYFKKLKAKADSHDALLAACEIGLSYINAEISNVPRPISDLQEDKEQVEQAIADAEKK